MLFKFGAHVTVSAYTEVEAATYEEALEIAKGRDAQIGDNSTGVYADDCWVVDDIDGGVENIHSED